MRNLPQRIQKGFAMVSYFGKKNMKIFLQYFFIYNHFFHRGGDIVGEFASLADSGQSLLNARQGLVISEPILFQQMLDNKF